MLYGLHENLSSNSPVQNSLLVAVIREQRALAAMPEVTPSNESNGVRPGVAGGEAMIWDSACARSALVTELFILWKITHSAEGSDDFSDTSACIALSMTIYLFIYLPETAVEWIKRSIHSKVFDELGLPIFFIADICFLNIC